MMKGLCLLQLNIEKNVSVQKNTKNVFCVNGPSLSVLHVRITTCSYPHSQQSIVSNKLYFNYEQH